MKTLILAALIALPVMAQTKKAEAPKEPAKAAASPTSVSQSTKYDLLLAKYNQTVAQLEAAQAERDHWKEMALGAKIAGDEARANQQLEMTVQRAQQECGAGKLRDLSGNCIVAPPNDKPPAPSAKK